MPNSVVKDIFSEKIETKPHKIIKTLLLIVTINKLFVTMLYKKKFFLLSLLCVIYFILNANTLIESKTLFETKMSSDLISKKDTNNSWITMMDNPSSTTMETLNQSTMEILSSELETSNSSTMKTLNQSILNNFNQFPFENLENSSVEWSKKYFFIILLFLPILYYFLIIFF